MNEAIALNSNKKHHSPFLITQTKSIEKTQIYNFKAKLLFENLMHISPQEIEEALNITDPNLKLPSFLELLDLKIRIQTEEQKLKDILPYGLHSGQAWFISKYLSFLYLICANIFLTRNIYQKFSLFYMKALHVIEPPTKDSDWETKPEWQILRIIAGTHLSLFYCKNEKLDKSIEILHVMKGTLRVLDHYPSASKILYHIYSSLGLLFSKMDKIKKTRKYLEKAIIHLENFIHKPKAKRPNDKDLMENFEEESKNMEYCKLINLYLNYKICKINFRLNQKDSCFEWLNKAIKLGGFYRETLEFIENREYILKYIEEKLETIKKNLENEIRKGLLIDLDQQMNDISDSYSKEIIEKEVNKPLQTAKEISITKKFFNKIEKPKSIIEEFKSEEKDEKAQKDKKERDTLLYRIRRTKSNFNTPTTLFPQPQTLKNNEVKALDEIRKIKSSQIKTAYRHYDFRQGVHIKSQSSNFTIIQKPQEKVGKVYEMLGRPMVVHHKKVSSKASKGNSLSTNASVTRSSNANSKNEGNIKSAWFSSPNSKELWKKINEFTTEFEQKNNLEKEIEKEEKKKKKEIRSVLKLSENENERLKMVSQHEKLDFIARNIFLGSKGSPNLKKKADKITDPLYYEVIGDLNDLNEEEKSIFPTEKRNLKKAEEKLADEEINRFFHKLDQPTLLGVNRDLDSLNTIKSSGEMEEEPNEIINSPLKDSNKMEKSSSKIRNNDSEKLFSVLKENSNLLHQNIRQVFKMDLLQNSEKAEKAARFIQKRVKIFMKNRKTAKEATQSPEQKSQSPSFQRVFKKYHTLTNLHLKEAFQREEPIIDRESQFSKIKEKLPERRHKSYVFNLQDMLMKRRQIKLTINQEYLILLNRKAPPKIKISSITTGPIDGSVDLRRSLASGHKLDSSLVFLRIEPKEFLPNITEKSMDTIGQEDDSQAQTPSSYNNILPSSELLPSLNELEGSDRSLKETDEKGDNKYQKKSAFSPVKLLTPVKLMTGMKRFQNQINENKKKMEAKPDINQLHYTPFYFSKFFAGKLRKWRVKYCKIKGKDKDRRIIFSLQTKHWNHDFECPILKEVRGKAFKDYRTIWPVVFQAFYDWMLNNNFLTEDDFKNEHKYMSDRLKAKISFFDWNQQTSKTTLASLTPSDLKACGDIKILLEILLANYFTCTLKVNGEAIKFIGLDLKESIINSYFHILLDLQKMHNKIRHMNFMGIYYEARRQKQLIDEFRNIKTFEKYTKLYSPQFLEIWKSRYSHSDLQEKIQRDLLFQSQLIKKYKNLKSSYRNELVLLLHRQLGARYVISQFFKKDLFNNLFWIVLVSVSGVLNKNFEENPKRKKSISSALDLTFVIKIFNTRYQKTHVNQETLGCVHFERQLQMKVSVKKIIKSLLLTGRLPTAIKKIINENLAKDLTIVDSKIKLKHRGESQGINEQEFFQQNVEKKINTITKNTMLFVKRKATANDPLEDLFDKSFTEIYNKDFIHKREENFDNFYENEENDEAEQIDEEIKTKQKNPTNPTKYGHLEIIQEEDVDFMNKSHELPVALEMNEPLDKEVLTFPSLQELKTSHYLKIRAYNCPHKLFARIIAVKLYNEIGLQVSIYSPLHRIITYGSIEDKKLIIIIMRILALKNNKLKKMKLTNILKMQSRNHGFIYRFMNKKKEKEFGLLKKTLILTNDLSVKSHLIKNSEDLQSKFQNKVLHFLIKLPKIGKASVTMNIYLCEDFIEAFQEYSFMMCFQINYYCSRTKALKLILNREDLNELFQMQLDKIFTTVDFLNKVRYLLQKISFVRQKLYSAPHFVPQSSLKRLASGKNKVLIHKKQDGKKQQINLDALRWFRNNFAKHELGKTQTNISKSFLEQYIQDTRIVGQFIKKIKSEFVLMTVCKHMILDYWILYSYIPKTCRYFVCYITNSDLLYMDFKDLDEIFPKQVYAECMGSKKRAFLNYKAFLKKFKYVSLLSPVGDNSDNNDPKFLENERKSVQINELAQYQIQTEENLDENQEFEIKKILESFKNKKMRKVMKIKTITDLTEKMNVAVRKGLNFERYQNLYNYVEYYIWENFSKKIELKSVDESCWIFFIKKFKMQLKQVLFTNYVKIDKQHDAHIEIFILLNKEKEKSKENDTNQDLSVIDEKIKDRGKEKLILREHSLPENKKSDHVERDKKITFENESESTKIKESVQSRAGRIRREDFGVGERKSKYKKDLERELELEREAELEREKEIEKQRLKKKKKEKEEKVEEKETLFSPFEPIGYAATSNHNILIRYLSLNKLSIQIEKINLREIINLFIADGFYKFQTNYMNSKFYLSDLQNLCNFIIYKIKSSNFANLIHDNSSKKKHHASKNSHFLKHMVDDEESSDTPTVQQIFNRKPLQIITFRFYLEERILSAVIYKKSSCQCITREYKFQTLKEHLLFFDVMLENKLYREICDRLLLLIKNILTIDVNFEFMLLDKNQE